MSEEAFKGCMHEGTQKTIRYGKERKRLPVLFCFKCGSILRVKFRFLRYIDEDKHKDYMRRLEIGTDNSTLKRPR